MSFLLSAKKIELVRVNGVVMQQYRFVLDFDTISEILLCGYRHPYCPPRIVLPDVYKEVVEIICRLEPKGPFACSFDVPADQFADTFPIAKMVTITEYRGYVLDEIAELYPGIYTGPLVYCFAKT